MIVDGRAIAQEIYSELAGFFRTHHAKLGIVVAGRNPVIASFVRIKERSAKQLGVEMVRTDLPEGATTAQVLQALHEIAPRCDGLIVQLPLPNTVDDNAALSAIPPDKDVDAMNPRHSIERPVEAPVALAVVEILARAGIGPAGKRVVVVGAGRLVGAPSARLLKRLGADVSLFTLQEGSIADLKGADIVVSGAGNPGFIKPEHLKKGGAFVDAGASEQAGKIRGDADPSCAEVASVFTPVPGGVGPVAVAMIFRNLKTLIEKEQ